MTGQLFINALIAGSLYALVAMGLSMMYAQARFINFSHGGIILVAPYTALFLLDSLKISWELSLIGGVVAAAVLGLGLEFAVFRQLRRQNNSPFVALIASLGIYVVLQNLLSLIFGDSTQSIRQWSGSTVLSILNGRITSVQLSMICTSVLAAISLVAFCKFTRIGAYMRAIASDYELSEAIGVNVDRTLLWTFGIGSGLAGAAGILLALDTDMTPKMGMNLLVMAMVAMILGGGRNIFGVVCGAYLLGIAQQFAAWGIGFQWQDAITFLILTVVLLLKPTGIISRTVRKATI